MSLEGRIAAETSVAWKASSATHAEVMFRETTITYDVKDGRLVRTGIVPHRNLNSVEASVFETKAREAIDYANGQRLLAAE